MIYKTTPRASSLSCVCCLSLTFAGTHNNPRPEGPQREREMTPVIFPLLTGTQQPSLSQNPWGEDIQQKKRLSHFIVFYHRELISLSLSQSVVLFFFTLLSHPHYSSFSLSLVLPHLLVFLYFIKFDGLTMPFEYASSSKPQTRKCREMLQSRGGDMMRWTTVSNPNFSLTEQKHVWRAQV